ncbi:Flagellar brake protein YcgR [compost metagenome]
MSALVIFKSIQSSSEQQMLLQRFLSTEAVVHLKDKHDRNLNLKAISLNSNMQLKCHLPTEVTMNLEEQTTFTATFYIGYEKYLFETRPNVSDSTITLPVMGLFHLQRRRNFRYQMPQNYSASLVIQSLNQAPCAYSTRILDISTEGCAVEIAQDATNLHLGDQVHAEIILGSHKPVIIQGSIKNIRPQGVSHLVLGVEFNHAVQPSEFQIITAITNLQREVYRKKSA